VPSYAEDRRLLVLLGPSEPAFWPWLRAELGSSGFKAQAASPVTFPPSVAEIEQLAAREDVVVGLAPLEAGAGIEIWLVDRASGKLTFREVILSLYKPGEAPDVISVRMVETLRATLMEVEQQRQLAEASPPRALPAPAAPPAPVRPSRFSLSLGGGAAFSPGGVGALGYLSAAFAWRVGTRLSLALDGALSPADTTLRGPEGDARINWYLAGVSASFCATDPSAPLRLRSGAGVWLAWLAALGQAEALEENRRTLSLSAIPHLDLGLHWSLTRRLGLGLDGSAGFSAPQDRLDFAGREAATWGRPLWLGRLSLETALD
jgi:hypothetical protein